MHNSLKESIFRNLLKDLAYYYDFQVQYDELIGANATPFSEKKYHQKAVVCVLYYADDCPLPTGRRSHAARCTGCSKNEIN